MAAFQKVAADAGLVLEGALEPAGAGPALFEQSRIRKGETFNLLSFVEHFIGVTDRIVLESDRIRILSKLEAHEFWERWWRDEQKK